MGVKLCGLFDTWRLFLAYEEFWEFFVFRCRKNGCASGIIFWQKFGNSFRSCFYEVSLR